MADKKISQLAAAAALTGAEVLELVQAGANVQATLDDIGTFIGVGGGPVVGVPVLGASVNATLGTSANDWNPTGWANGLEKNKLRITTDVAGSTLNSLAASGAVDGQLAALVVLGPTPLLITHEHGASVAANRFACPGDGDYMILSGQAQLLIRDSSRWRLL